METYSKGTRTPWGATANLGVITKDWEGGLVSKRNVDDAVMGESGEGSNGGALLTTALGTGGDKESSVFAPVTTSGPLLTGGVPECLPLRWEVTVTGWDTEEESIVLLESIGIDHWVRGLGWSMHFGENILWESLGNLVDVGLDTSLLKASLLGLGELLDVTIHRILRGTRSMVSDDILSICKGDDLRRTGKPIGLLRRGFGM
jgi:hypothetical protein